MSGTPSNEKKEPGAVGRLLMDLGPLLIFFLVNFLTPGPQLVKIITATIAFMIAMVVVMLISVMKYRHISPLLLFSGVMVLVLGGLTVWLHNDTFIKLKPTIYYVTVASLLIFGMLTGRNLLKAVLGTAYPGLSDHGWKLLTRNWAAFFLIMACVNEAVWRNSTTEFWIGFKLWGFLPATFIFAIANVPMLMRHGMQLETAKEEPPVPPTQ
jgi:intracellular septation protein